MAAAAASGLPNILVHQGGPYEAYCVLRSTALISPDITSPDTSNSRPQLVSLAQFGRIECRCPSHGTNQPAALYCVAGPQVCSMQLILMYYIVLDMVQGGRTC